MTIFRREILVGGGPARLVVQYDPAVAHEAQLFTVQREGAMKTILLGLDNAQDADWLARALLDLRDHLWLDDPA